MSISLIIAILITHFVGDYFLQTRNEAILKASDFGLMVAHSGKYGVCFIVVCAMCSTQPYYMIFILMMVHFTIDFVACLVSKNMELWAKRDTYGFLNVIGISQLVHLIVLFALFNLVK